MVADRSARPDEERPPTADAAPGARARAALDAIAGKAFATNRARAREIESAVLALADGRPIDEPTRLRAARAAHQIAGSAGTFGGARASLLARELERYLVDGASPEPSVLLPATAALDELHRELAGHDQAPQTEPGPTSPPRRDLLVAGGHAELAQRIGAAAHARDWDTRWAPDGPLARAAVADRRPDVVLLDLGLPPDGGMDLLVETAQGQEAIPTIVLCGLDAFLDRVEASRAGASGFVDADLPPEKLVTAAIDTIAAREEERAHVLALDDDFLVLDLLRALFADNPIEVTGVSGPTEFWAALATSQPDLLLLDVDLPGVTGLELCRMVRADARWASLPIIVLTGSVREDDVAAVFRAGADDYVTKPVAGPELQARIESRLERERVRRRHSETDPLTGLRNREALESAYQRLVQRADRASAAVSVALLDLDDFRRFNDEHGHAAGDGVIQRLAALLTASFGPEDVLGRWGGHEFMVAMMGLPREDGVARVAGVLESLRTQTFDTGRGRPVRASFSAAVAEYGRDDGDDLRRLYRLLAETVGAAARAGGNRVLPVGWRPEQDRNVVDVLLVEDDQTLADVLLHALQTRGLRGEHIADGQAALRRLIGPDAVSARVVLLDVDLPGLNGLDVLGRLGSEGVLARSRVIMLTAHGGEREVLEALRLGAFDHVAKPFSVPVLVQRLRRALQS